MNKESRRETMRKTYSGVITRSRRKSSLKLEEVEETQPDPETKKSQSKKSKIPGDLNEIPDLPNVQSLFSDFIEALNQDEEISFEKQSKRRNKKEILGKREDGDDEMEDSILKRVKREGRKSRRIANRTQDLETIAEDVSKENATNYEQKPKIQVGKVLEQSLKSRDEDFREAQKPIMQNKISDLDPQKSDENFKSRILFWVIEVIARNSR